MGQLHNELRDATSLLRGFRRLFGGTDPGLGVERLSETLVPIVDIWDRPEFAFLRDEFIWWTSRSDGLVAGQFSGVGIAGRTTTPNSLTIVTRIRNKGASSVNVRLVTATAHDSDGGLTRRDNRIATDIGALVFDRTQVAQRITLGVVLDAGEELDEEWVIRGGATLELLAEAQIVATAIGPIEFFGYHRFAPPGEASGV